LRKLIFDCLWPAFEQHRLLAGVLVLCGFLASMTEGIGISLFVPLFNALDPDLGPTENGEGLIDYLAALFSGVPAKARVAVIASAIFGAVLAKAVLTYATTYLSTLLAARTTQDLRSGVIAVVLGSSPGTLSRLGHGRVMNVLSNESWRTGDAVALSMRVGTSLFQLAVYIAILMLISWQLTLVVSVLLGLIGVAIRIWMRRVSEISAQVTRSNAEVSRKTVDLVGGAEVVRGFGTEERERESFRATSERLAKDSVRSWMLTGAISPLYEVIAAAVIVGVLLSATQAGTGLAPLLVFVFVLFRLVPVARRLERERAELLATEGPVRETLAVVSATGEQELASGTRHFDGIRRRITLENVSFRYMADANAALDDISLEIPATGLTAIVGPSGAGKSTLGRLILRLLDPTSGRILIDGTPLTDFDLPTWRSRVAVVPQKPYLFNTTVRANIAYGAPAATDAEVERAAEAAGAQQFIENLADGYDTKLGEGGIELSGGEAQRICLARAIARKPELLLLDEATSSLDSNSEEVIGSAVAELGQHCAVVVIAHRSAIVKAAGRILVLDRGKLAEKGDFRSLASAGGLFSSLYKDQEGSHGDSDS
jgi:subfamily B ATP-binding cassette protein MsbA